MIDYPLMIDEIPHRSFPKIPRVNNVNVIITEKLDGTNGVIWVSEDKQHFKFGSRNKWVGYGKDDNAGFYQFCMDNVDLLERLDPGYHYGEFVGPGIQSNKYGLTEKMFYFFDTRLKNRFEDSKVLHTVPLVAVCDLRDIPQFLPLQGTKSAIGNTTVEGYMLFIPEAMKYIKCVYEKNRGEK